MDFSLRHYYIYIGVSSLIHYQSLKNFFEQKGINFNEYDDSKQFKEGINISNIDLNIGLEIPKYKLFIIFTILLLINLLILLIKL